jgi:hypothetical protein
MDARHRASNDRSGGGNDGAVIVESFSVSGIFAAAAFALNYAEMRACAWPVSARSPTSPRRRGRLDQQV